MDLFYNCPNWPISMGLLALMFAADEVGYRLGRRHRDEPEPSRAVSYALKGSVFALVALLLGFSFSVTSDRHTHRQRQVLAEANAIGTCHLRAGLLGEPARTTIRESLRGYVAARLTHHEQGADPAEERRREREMARALDGVWRGVEEANRTNAEAVRVSQIVPAANDVIDQSGTYLWETRTHLPPAVLALLAVCVVLSGALVGHSSGQLDRRHLGLWVASNVLFVLVLFVVLDFDRPRRGLIRVDQRSLIEVGAQLDAAGR